MPPGHRASGCRSGAPRCRTSRSSRGRARRSGPARRFVRSSSTSGGSVGEPSLRRATSTRIGRYGKPTTDRAYPVAMPRNRLISLAPPAERAFLVAVDTGDATGWNAEESLFELAALAETAGADVVGAEWQN